MANELDTTVEANGAPTGEEFEATVTVTNTGDAPKQTVFRLRVDDSVLAAETVTVPVDETREVRLDDDLPNPEEVAITRNGQKIGCTRVTDDG
jgi:hypothetical protein